jgi:hypothetical protein
LFLITVKIKNPTEYDTEFFSLDFDQDYLKEEEQLAKYDEFNNSELLFFPVREPGAVFWDFIAKANQKKARKEELEKKLKELKDNEEEKAAILKKLEEFSDKEHVAEYPKRVEDNVMHHVNF